MNILIAEDDNISRLMLVALVKKWGFDPIQVEDGDQAWQLLQTNKIPSLLLLDWEMPGFSGIQLCKKLRNRNVANPHYIILLTARTEIDDIIEGLEAGANDYISKPFNNSELRARINVGERMLDLQSERNKAEQELKKLSRAVEYGSSAMIITNRDGIIEYVNPKFSDVTGYSKEEAIGQNPNILQSGEIPTDFYTELWQTISKGSEWRGEFHNKKKDGSLYWGRASISGIQDNEGVITHFICIQDDVTREYEMTEKLSYHASHDTLTGLINRHEFELCADDLLNETRRKKSTHALCFMDLDQFKVINDTCGHVAGDELLRQLSALLQGIIRQSDIIARLGGDEFAVLMKNCSLDQATRVANNLLGAVRDFQFNWEQHSFRVGISIGLVAVTDDISDLSELLKLADAACYMAKDSGRNRIHIYQSDDTLLANRHGQMQWVSRINSALDGNNFQLFVQPIVSFNDENHRHYEVLIRMRAENGEIIPPGAFLPSAERYDLISKIDSWVVGNVFSTLASNPKFVARINFISINLSGPSLGSGFFLSFIIDQLKSTGIEPEKICFEVTETVAVSNLTATKQFMTTLRDIGCQFSLDDFGSGVSSFGYLKNLPVDYLKIDGMFVKDMVDDPIDHAMVKSINEIGHVMGMKTIAEFVENDEIVQKLKVIGVDYGQGYGLGKPQPLDELL